MSARRSEARSVEHGTLVLERRYDAPPARVFEAWRDVKARERWSPPNPETKLVYDQAEFREGGLDVVRCGAPDDLKYRAEVRYLDIVPDQRIVFAESVSESGVRVAVALITAEFLGDGGATQFTFTAQIAALDGADMIAGYEEGWSAALDNLANEVRRAA